MKYTSTLKAKLIYIFRINDKEHEGCLKIGEATCDIPDYQLLKPNSQELNNAAHERIKTYTQTAAISYELLHTEITVFNNKGLKSFTDHEVRDVLYRSGVAKKLFDKKNKSNEWVITDLETAKKAIAAVKSGKESLHSSEVTNEQNPVIFRPEQKDAIEKTIMQFKRSNEMLWFAKMRFGKTLSALQVVKEMDFTKTLILTHRPVVDAGWFEDFQKIFYDKNNFKYGSKPKKGNHGIGETFESLEKQSKKDKTHYVYFASMQDLRGAKEVGGPYDKNDDVFNTKWDCIIIDEAHEGTQTELGKNVIAVLRKSQTKMLRLSGTPFNLIDSYQQEEIFTWDYVMEQRAKAEWDKIHFGDPNPYASLPRLNIFTYDLGKLIHSYVDEEKAFNFREFFRVSKENKFLHENDVLSFLNLIVKGDKESNYPYSTIEYQNNFRHSLWMVPGVKEARALSTLLQKHPVFSQFTIVNVAGEGDEEEENEEALKKVKKAISDYPDNTYTITLSCGRLTTGVSVPAWTAVFMLSGSYNTTASSYMQTIFRVQTPATINGRIKTDCFVFDFAPDRTLKVIAETAKISAKAGKTSDDDRTTMGEFLNFCPIIGMDGSRMKPYNVDRMLEQLKRVYVERVIRNGFEDGYLYNNDQLMKLGAVELKDFEKLRKIIGRTKAMPKSGDIDINKQGFTSEEFEKLEGVERKAKEKKQLTKAELKLLKEKEEKRKLRNTAISILRGISIRMPMLIYGADVKNEDKEINIDNFVDLIDDNSWEEFMPKGVTKAEFEKFKKYYETDVFRSAGKRIREMARASDNLSVEERIERITNIFSTFRNPDKETVLTPWRVVNMHMGDCVGGYVFYDDNFKDILTSPRLVNQEVVTENIFDEDTRILEINSKSGLYPLFMAYSVYRSRLVSANTNGNKGLDIKEQQKLWDKVIADNIFVICKTPMAKSITKRTLVGFRDSKINAEFYENLISEIIDNPSKFINTITKGKTFWKSTDTDNMKFNAIVGNPPYQLNDGSGASDDAANPIYQNFVRIAKQLDPFYFSLIMPSKWMVGGKAILKSFRKEMMEDSHLSRMFDYEDSAECFTNQHIDGGICYFLWDKEHSGRMTYFYKPENAVGFKIKRTLADGNSDIVIRDYRRQSLIEKTKSDKTFFEIVSARKPFGINTDLFNNKEAYPEFKLNSKEFKDSVLVWGVEGIKGGAKRVSGFIKESSIKKKRDWISKHKLFISKAFSANAVNPPELIVAGPNVVCTETFLVIGPFSNKNSLDRCHIYTKTNFFRTLLFFGRGTMQVSQDVFRFIPLQDFTVNSDIDWSKSINEIDQLLYKKYGLNKGEISFIESTMNAE
jgi:hypothetical protein